MAIGCSANIAKAILIVLNILFWLSGLALIVCGAIVVSSSDVKAVQNIFPENSEMLSNAGFGAIAIGVLIFLIGFSGCCGAIKESRCLLGVYILLVTLIICGEIALGVFVALRKNFVVERVTDHAKGLIKKDNDEAIAKALDGVQKLLKCCGIENVNDWKNSSKAEFKDGNKLPASCCSDEGKACTLTSTTRYKDVCKEGIIGKVQQYQPIILGSAIGLAVFQIVILALAIILCRNTTKEEEI